MSLLMQKYQLQHTQHERDRLDEQLNREASLSKERLKLARDQYHAANISYNIASENYRLAFEKKQEGSLSANRLLEIEAVLSEAASSLTAALTDFYIAQSVWYYSIGSELLGKGL